MAEQELVLPEAPEITSEIPLAERVSLKVVRTTLPAHPEGVLPALQSMLKVLIAGLFVLTFTVQPIRIPSSSMEPTLLVGDFLLLDKQSVAPDRTPLLPPAGIRHGDVIVFHDPVDPSVHLVKRVIGVPGDRLHLRDGVVYRNGLPLREDYAVYRKAMADAYRDDFPEQRTMDARVDPAWWIRLRSLVREGDLVVPPDNYFVLGDNRNESEDSRYWGLVPRRDIVGKPVLVYFSWRSADDSDTAESAAAEGRAAKPLGLSGPALGRFDFARWDRFLRVIR